MERNEVLIHAYCSVDEPVSVLCKVKEAKQRFILCNFIYLPYPE